MRYSEVLCETVAMLVQRLARIAQQCSTPEQFIIKTDGEDVLYRGHYAAEVGDNVFLSDYVGHAREYAGDDGRIDGFGYDPNDVLYYDDRRFDEMRGAYRNLSGKQLAAIYQNSHSGLPTGQQALAKVKPILRGNMPYSQISGDSATNDLLVPLLQLYARHHGKNIIAFHGNDYADYGGQTEYVVGDISKLIDLRALYAKVHQGNL